MEPEYTRLRSRKRSALTSDEEFRFQPEPEKSKRAHESLSLDPKVRGDATLALSSNREVRRSSSRSSSASLSSVIQERGCNRSSHSVPARDPKERGRLPQTLKDDVPSNICETDVEFVARHQPGEYVAQMPLPNERISKLTEGTSRGFSEITAPLCMYKMGYSFPLKGFVRDVFSYYQLSPGQLHPNGWMLVSAFEKFCRMVGLEPTVNVFRSCYQLVASSDGGIDVRWFFTFANRNQGAMKDTLTGKLYSQKKWRERWVVIRYTGPIARQGGTQQIWGCSDYWRTPPPPEVNRKPRLTTEEAKNYAVLDAAKTDFEVDKMARGYYQEVLKGLIVGGEASWMPPVKSLSEGSSSQATGDGRDETGREDSPLLVGELPTLEGTVRLQTMGAGTPEADIQSTIDKLINKGDGLTRHGWNLEERI